MIVTKLEIVNPDGSKTAMVFIDNEDGTGSSMTEEAYLNHLAVNEASTK
jgi:hypothetical protein